MLHSMQELETIARFNTALCVCRGHEERRVVGGTMPQGMECSVECLPIHIMTRAACVLKMVQPKNGWQLMLRFNSTAQHLQYGSIAV